jgi:signal transduction histidine kinase
VVIQNEKGNNIPSILLFLFMWTVIAVLAATTAFIALGSSTVNEWLSIFGIMASFFYTWAPIGYSVYWLANRAGPWLSRWYVQVPMHILYLAVISASLPFLIHGITWRVFLYGDRAMGFHALNIFIYSFILIGSMMLKYYHLVRAKEKAAQAAALREVALERSLDKSRMEALRAQINPHFLFNTLNSIASLVASSANKEAYKVIERLAALLRNALDFSRDSVVTLQEELRFLDDYVEIEKVRYAQRLVFTKSVPEECLTAIVPSLSLQPLVENAIKHAVARSSGPVSIHVQASCSGGNIALSVSDNGPGVRLPVNLGVGLSNVRDRLAHMFDGNASLDIGNNETGGATVTLVFSDHRPVEKRRIPGEENISQGPALDREAVST